MVSTKWPLNKTALLTLDLECDYGTAIEDNAYEALGGVRELAALLERFDVPLSCFLQTEVLDVAPEAVAELERCDSTVEFHAHSHTHPRRDTADVPFEVDESVGRIRDRFGTSPVGFRFPDGWIDPSDYEVLGDHGVDFSSSVFPSLRPGRFNNLQQSRRPFYCRSSDVLELPFSVLSKYLPVPVSLSYLKLLGTPFSRLLYSTPPETIVFDFHMHDLVTPSTFDRLPFQYRAIYSRNKHMGFGILAEFISTLQALGYSFVPINEVYEEVIDEFRN